MVIKGRINGLIYLYEGNETHYSYSVYTDNRDYVQFIDRDGNPNPEFQIGDKITINVTKET